MPRLFYVPLFLGLSDSAPLIPFFDDSETTEMLLAALPPLTVRYVMNAPLLMAASPFLPIRREDAPIWTPPLGSQEWTACSNQSASNETTTTPPEFLWTPFTVTECPGFWSPPQWSRRISVLHLFRMSTLLSSTYSLVATTVQPYIYNPNMGSDLLSRNV